MLAEILSADADIIALEEMDHFDDFFQPALAAYGYTGFFTPKLDSPARAFGYYSDGVALFWREPLKEVQSFANCFFTDDIKVTLIAVRFDFRGTEFVAAATHLKAKSGEKNEQYRLEQVKLILREVANLGGAVPTQSATGVPWVILGDFNTSPGESEEHLAMVIPYLVNEAQAVFAYPLDGSVLTTSKIRTGHVKKEQIDYIMIHGALTVGSTLEIPEITEPTLLPGMRYPSDHFLIGADLIYVNV